jgi:hypothetical protein
VSWSRHDSREKNTSSPRNQTFVIQPIAIYFTEPKGISYDKLYFNSVKENLVHNHKNNLLCMKNTNFWVVPPCCLVYLTTQRYSPESNFLFCGILAVNSTIKSKPIKLFSLVLFNNCHMFQSTFGTIFRQFH